MNFSLAIQGDLRGHIEARLALAAGGMMKAAGLASNEVKGKFRAAVLAGGLGPRLANTVRGTVYPRKGARSLSPTAFVYTRAPELIQVFAYGAEIRPVNGSVYLWIPTENVPGARGGKRMSALQVEERYGDFEYVPSLTRPGVVLAVVPAVRAKTKAGWRKASAGRVGQGRNAVRIVMFVLVRQVRLKKRIDFARVEADAAAAWPEIVARTISAELSVS